MKFHNRKSDRSHPRIPLRTASRSSGLSHAELRFSRAFVYFASKTATRPLMESYKRHQAAAFAVFFVRIYHVTGPGKDSGKKCMVKSSLIVVITDRSSKKSRQFLRNTIAVTTPDGIKQCFPVPGFALSSNQRTTVVSKISLISSIWNFPAPSFLEAVHLYQS